MTKERLVVASLSLLLALAGLLWISRTDGGDTLSGIPRVDRGPVHVHGLGLNPADGALFLATHSGLFRVGRKQRVPERVGARFQDTMGFTVIGPDRFLGSGHPDLAEARERNLPSLLGLIESADAGRSWEPVSLLGEADFHVLRVAGVRVYGYDAANDRLLVSADRGRSWQELEKPGSILDLAIHPRDARRLAATTADGLFESRDAARSWRRVSDAVGLLAWPERLYLAAVGGDVFVARDGGHRLERRGALGGAPAALVAAGADELYAALHDGTVKHSGDGGASWAVRATP